MPESKPTVHKPKVATEITRDGLPATAYAIVVDTQDTGTWFLPHHTKAILQPLVGKVNAEKLALHIERTVDWSFLPICVAGLSRYGHQGERVKASPEEIIHAARHLAEHYRNAGLSVPDNLGALI